MSGPFTLALQEFAKKAGRLADDAVGRVVISAAARIDARSPVDTGHFRANWQLGVDHMPGGTLATVDKRGAETQGKIIASVPDEAAGHVYYIANNLPYAQRLEHGWSKQAPQGMVGLTVVESDSIVAEAIAAAKAANP